MYLGHNRLSIIDIENGNQPFWSEDKNLVILFNGEIYNYLSIKKKLQNKGIKFLSNSDTEVILKLYENSSELGFKNLQGMFAFIIIDFRKGSIISARDFYGKKPIYYFNKNKNYNFIRTRRINSIFI